MFYCKLDSAPSLECEELDFYSEEVKLRFGWLNSKFVSNISGYVETEQIDGVCPFEWKQGIKHDCSPVMELERINGHFVNEMTPFKENQLTIFD